MKGKLLKGLTVSKKESICYPDLQNLLPMARETRTMAGGLGKILATDSRITSCFLKLSVNPWHYLFLPKLF